MTTGMTRRTRTGTALLAIGLLGLGAGCSTVKTATGMTPDTSPRVDASRLSGLSQTQLTDVTAKRTELDQARSVETQARRDADDVTRILEQAKSQHDLAKAELKHSRQAAETSTKELEPGAEQRTGTQPGEAAAPLDLATAEQKERNYKARVEYLEKLHAYTADRQKVAEHLVSVEQARLDVVSYDALKKYRPNEASTLGFKTTTLTKVVTEREKSLAEARAEMEKKRGEALSKYRLWNEGFGALPESERGEPAPSVESYKPL